MASNDMTAEKLMNTDFPRLEEIPSLSSQRTQERIDKIDEKIAQLGVQMSLTDSDMFKYYATLNVERLDKVRGKLLERLQRQEMQEQNI